jgi:tetratricopeptide (TPR) repeat protein
MTGLSRVRRMILAMASAFLGSPAGHHASRPDLWVGRRVIIRFGAAPRAGEPAFDERVEDSPRGRRRRVVRTYRVEKAEGDRLWLRAERSGARGWAPAGDVVPLDRAVAIFSEELRDHPDDPAIYLDRAAALAEAGDFPAAVADCDVAIRLDPESEVAHVCRGNFLASSGEFDRALADFDRAIQLDPGYALAHYARGFTAVLKGDARRALADLDEAARLDPRDPVAPRARAWILAVWPDPDLREPSAAVASATRACELTDWSEAPSLAALAAAHASAGDFASAVATQEKAVALRPEGPARIEAHRRLALYRSGSPYRDVADDASTA